MKLMKRAAALMLCLCLLIGLPISVQAVNIPKDKGLELINAYAMSNRFVINWTQGSGGTNKLTDHCVVLYFNDQVRDAYHIRNNNYVKLYIEPYKADGTSLGLQNAGYQAVDYYGTTAGNNKKVVVVRFGTQNGSSFVASSNGFSYWRGQGAVGFRLYIVDNKGTGINNKVDGWATTISYGWCLKANAQHGGKDAVIKDILFEEDCLSVKQYIAASDSKIQVQFSEPVAMSALKANNGPLSIELHATLGWLNANNEPGDNNGKITDPVKKSWPAVSAKTIGDGQWIEVDFGENSVSDALAYAAANSCTLNLHFSDNGSATSPAWGNNGEQLDNGLIDGIWAVSNNCPLLAISGKHRTDVAGDTTYCARVEAPRVSEAEIREDNSLLIKFSQAVAMPTTAVTATLGLYNAQNQKHADYGWSVPVSEDTATFYGSNQDAFVVTVPSTAAESIRSIAKGLESQGYTLRLTLTSHDGAVDGVISEITAKNNADMKLLATVGGDADAVVIDVTCVETKLLKLEKVDAFKENTLVLTFNQDVVVNNGYYMGLTLVENGGNCYQSYNAATGKYTIVRGNPQDGVSKPAQWDLSFKGYLNGQKNVVYATVNEGQGNFASSVSTGWNLSKIMTFCEQYSQGKLMFRIQENNGNNSGTIDCIHVDGDTANTLLSNFGNDQVHYEIADFRNDVIVESAKLIDGDLIEITFNKPITNTWYHATERGSAMLRLSQYNEAKGQWSWYRYDGKDAGAKYSDTPTQWGWGLSNLFNYNPKNTPTDAIPANTEASKVWYYKWNEGKMDILDLLAMVKDSESVFAQDNVQLTLVLEKSGTEDKMLINCVQNFTTADGNYYLYDNDALQWRHHAAITTELAIPSMLKVTDITVNDESTMTVTFNKDIESVKDIEPSIRLLDGSGTVKDQMILTVKAIEGNTVTFAARNSVKETYRNFSKVWQTANENGWKMQFALTQTSTSEPAKVKRDGMVNGVISKDGSYLISSILSKDVIDAYYIMVDRNNYAFNPESFSITNVEQIGKNVLIVEFSENIQLVDMEAKPFVALRMVDPTDHEAIRLKSDGQPTKDAKESKNVMQWPASSIDFYGDRKDALIVTFPDTTDIGLLSSKANMDAKFMLYEVMLCMEESSNDSLAPDRVKGNYLMHHIRRANDQKQLESSKIKNTNGGLVDGVFESVKPLDLTADLQVEGVKVLDQTRIVITFSEAVNINSPSGYIRVVNDVLATVKASDGTALNWGGRLAYYDEAKTQIVFTLNVKTTGTTDAQANGLDDLFSRGYAKDGNRLALVVGDRADKAVMNGIVDSITGTTGKPLYADPMTGAYDALWLDVDATQIPQGELTVTDVTIVSDIDAVLTFSAPVEIVDNPYLAVRLMTKDNFLISISPEGKYAEHQKGYTPVQWQGVKWVWNNEEHTQIRISIGKGTTEAKNFTEMMAVDWDSLFPGAHLTVGFEENNAAVIDNNGRVDNVRLAADERVRLRSNSKLGSRDGCFVVPVVDVELRNVTATAKIINDMQIRVSFSEPVAIHGNPYIAFRYIDEETDRVYYNGDEYNRAPVQFGGKWEWANNAHTAIIWTMYGNATFGACNLYDIINYRHALESMTGRKMQFCLEEKTDADFAKVGQNNRIDNISSLDGKNHLVANLAGDSDGLYLDLNMNVLRNAAVVKLISAKAVSDQTIELTFSEPVRLADENAPTVELRYLSADGNADVLTNGKIARFTGQLSPKADDPCVLIWTLNSKLADNLTDIFNYNGQFKWNSTSHVALIMENESEEIPTWSMRLWGITSTDGVRNLEGSYQKYPSYVLDVEIDYDIPAPESATGVEEAPQITYYSDYTIPVVLGAGMVVVSAIVLLFVCLKKGKKEEM